MLCWTNINTYGTDTISLSHIWYQGKTRARPLKTATKKASVQQNQIKGHGVCSFCSMSAVQFLLWWLAPLLTAIVSLSDYITPQTRHVMLKQAGTSDAG